MADYTCKVCGAAAEVSATGDIRRSCVHKGSTIIADRTCVLYGEGGADAPSLAERAQLALQTIFGALKL